MLEASRQPLLLFDSACSVCSYLAQEIERETGGVLPARGLGRPEVQAWLEQARPGWRWEPTLLEVDGDHPRAFTGLGMAFRLVQVLGLRRAWRVARLVQRVSVPATGVHEERRQFLRYSGSLLLTLLGSSILAACGASTTSSAPSPTAAPTAKVTGEFVSRDLTVHTWVGLSTDGQQVTAYACDGDDEHPITFAQWFTGSVTNNAVDLTNANGAHLVATFTSQAATGTVTLPGGKSFSFTANAITTSEAGLYRSEQTIGGVTYLAGWVVPESAVAPTPTAFLLGSLAPAGLLSRCSCSICCCGGGIIKPRTNQLLPAPRLTSQEIASGQVTVPNVGTFALTHCTDGKCS